jgi:DNA-binding ferritin-like protein
MGEGEGRKKYSEVLLEGIKGDVKLVLEGHAVLDKKIEDVKGMVEDTREVVRELGIKVENTRKTAKELEVKVGDTKKSLEDTKQSLEDTKQSFKQSLEAMDKKHDANTAALYDLMQDVKKDVGRIETKLDAHMRAPAHAAV